MQIHSLEILDIIIPKLYAEHFISFSQSVWDEMKRETNCLSSGFDTISCHISWSCKLPYRVIYCNKKAQATIPIV
ncbi:MAG: hypothetical protein LBH98_04540 [Chitinispirillales bacterium]|nr:hypothetical protein [Chitinispirillales bacterium]